jgi:hypothetical protein
MDADRLDRAQASRRERWQVSSYPAEQMAFITILAILVVAVLVVIAMFSTREFRTRLRLPGVDFSFEGKGGRRWRPAKPARRRQPSKSKRRAWLVAKRRGRDWEFVLDGLSHVTIGRDPDNHVRLQDPRTSGRQAVIQKEGDRYYIYNQSRTTGTLVNGRSIGKQILGNGNKILMGNTELIFRENP